MFVVVDQPSQAHKSVQLCWIQGLIRSHDNLLQPQPVLCLTFCLGLTTG